MRRRPRRTRRGPGGGWRTGRSAERLVRFAYQQTLGPTKTLGKGHEQRPHPPRRRWRRRPPTRWWSTGCDGRSPWGCCSPATGCRRSGRSPSGSASRGSRSGRRSGCSRARGCCSRSVVAAGRSSRMPPARRARSTRTTATRSPRFSSSASPWRAWRRASPPGTATRRHRDPAGVPGRARGEHERRHLPSCGLRVPPHRRPDERRQRHARTVDPGCPGRCVLVAGPARVHWSSRTPRSRATRRSSRRSATAMPRPPRPRLERHIAHARVEVLAAIAVAGPSPAPRGPQAHRPA